MERYLSSSEVERVLRRASDLARRDGEPAMFDDGISEHALLAAADEAGIPVDAVRRSIAIERLGAPAERRVGDRLVGPKVVSFDVELAMPVAEAMARLDAWMEHGHHLRRERWAPFEAEWRRRDGVVAFAARTLRSATGEGHLGEVNSVAVVARAAGTGSVLRLSIDRRVERAVWMGSGATVATAGVGVGVVATFVMAPVFALVAPAGVAAGVGLARIGRASSDEMARELARVTAAVGGRVKPTTLRGGVARWVHSWHRGR